MKKRKGKPINVPLDVYRVMEKIRGSGKVPYNPTIINDKEEEDEPREEGT